MAEPKIITKKLTEAEIEEKGIRNWPIWTKELSTFDWYYESQEECLILEGHFWVDTEEMVYQFFKGEYIIFPKGLKCKWTIVEPVKKHYKFS